VTAVVHLVRAANGLAPFEAFLRSYREHDAGHEHALVLLLKGFGDPEAAAPYLRLADDLRPLTVSVSDDGLDLTAYRAAAAELPHRRLCLLNSYSTILADGWLGHMARAADAPGVGVVGATGSWGSHRSFALHLLRLPNGYRGTLPDRRAAAPAFQSVGTAPQIGRIERLARAARDIPREIAGHPGFPAPHVRTNAFLIERELLLALATGPLRSKAAAYRFEGGAKGLPGQLRRRGLEPVIVGRAGTPIAAGDWPGADIFWQGDQHELLVADNQTRAYAAGSADVRDALSRYAWGARARPADAGDALR
jgi:hypothetical protein